MAPIDNRAVASPKESATYRGRKRLLAGGKGRLCAEANGLAYCVLGEKKF